MQKQNQQLRDFGLVAILISFTLIGCVTNSPASRVSLLPAVNIYQPRVLLLPAGLPLQTETGIYTPRTREVWHSQSAFRELELQVVDLTSALNQLRAK